MVTSDEQERHLCVEIAIVDRSWVERLPPAPGGADALPVTLSFDDLELAARDRTAVTELGYVVVGPAAAGHVTDVAHLLVGPAAVERHARWWRALLDLATRVYDLRFGPVQLALRDVLAVHLDHRANGTAATPLRVRAPRPPSA
ncbi:MAG: hypothetical protein KY460_15120 [Actinobacteria bacterium]|nr:hypothetical protein [Actinomycetota bacterium]